MCASMKNVETSGNDQPHICNLGSVILFPDNVVKHTLKDFKTPKIEEICTRSMFSLLLTGKNRLVIRDYLMAFWLSPSV